VARAELDKVQSQLRVAQEAAERKGQEIRELNHMLKAWEAMRLGKDAQIAALMERAKRHEEDAAEKTRTVEALRRKLSVSARPASSGGGGYGGSLVGAGGAGGVGYSSGSVTSGLLGAYGGAGGSLGSGLGAGLNRDAPLRRSWGPGSPGPASPGHSGY
jgi:hypothetical protein